MKPETRRVLVVHRHWTGHLLLRGDGTVTHERQGSRGTYTLSDGLLRVDWAKFAPEVFVARGEGFVLEEMLPGLADLGQLRAGTLYGRVFEVGQVSVRLPAEGCEVLLRPATSDLPTFRQVILNREYDSPDLPAQAATIVDAGGNIGLSAVVFAARYPTARLIVVEPDAANFALLARNTAAFGDRIVPERAALWTHDGEIAFATQDAAGRSLGAWGGQVVAGAGGETVPCVTMDTLIRRHGLDRIDILKVDIEGAEAEVFADRATGWLDRVGMVIVETHDRFKPGSRQAVTEALARDFDMLPKRGENLFFRRRG